MLNYKVLRTALFFTSVTVECIMNVKKIYTKFVLVILYQMWFKVELPLFEYCKFITLIQLICC